MFGGQNWSWFRFFWRQHSSWFCFAEGQNQNPFRFVKKQNQWSLETKLVFWKPNWFLWKGTALAVPASTTLMGALASAYPRSRNLSESVLDQNLTCNHRQKFCVSPNIARGNFRVDRG